MKRTSRKPSKLSQSVHHQLNSYTLAASAAGVGLLALAQPAEAKIIYHKSHHLIKFGHYNLDLNHDYVADFKFVYWSFVGDTRYSVLSILPAGEGNAVEGRKGRASYHSSFAYALNQGSRVDPKHPFYGTNMVGAFGGEWSNVTNRYLGLKFRIHGRTHYGWARLNVKINSGRCQGICATLTGYAYETIPNKPIIAGKTDGKDVITIEPASLGHLARGASDIPDWRAKEMK